MTTNTDTLKYITINGQTDVGFAMSIKKAQASKYATQLLKRAVMASIYAIERCQDDLVGSHHVANRTVVIAEPVIEQVSSERMRNSQGMFVAS